MQEPRLFVRLETKLKVVYTVLHQDRPIPSVTSSLGGGGISFFADEPLAAGSRLKVELCLPDEEQPIPFTAEVAWSEESTVIGQTAQMRAVEIGVRFVEIAPEDQEAIMRYVASSLQAPRPVGSVSR